MNIFRLNLITLSLVFATLLTLESCVTLKTSSFSDPKFINKSYSKICVISNDKNLNRRTLIENELVEDLAAEGVNVTAGVKLFPPTREWNESEKYDTLISKGYEGILVLTILYINTDEVYNKEIDGNKNSRKNNELNRGEFESKLIDLNTGETAWKGYSESDLVVNVAGSIKEITFSKLSKSIVNELEDKGHITPK